MITTTATTRFEVFRLLSRGAEFSEDWLVIRTDRLSRAVDRAKVAPEPKSRVEVALVRPLGSEGRWRCFARNHLDGGGAFGGYASVQCGPGEQVARIVDALPADAWRALMPLWVSYRFAITMRLLAEARIADGEDAFTVCDDLSKNLVEYRRLFVEKEMRHV